MVIALVLASMRRRRSPAVSSAKMFPDLSTANGLRSSEDGFGGGRAITDRAPAGEIGNGRIGAGGDDANALVLSVGDQNISGAIERHALGKIEQGVECRTAVATGGGIESRGCRRRRRF